MTINKTYYATNENNGNRYKIAYKSWYTTGTGGYVGEIKISRIETSLLKRRTLVCRFDYGFEEELEISRELERLGYKAPTTVFVPSILFFVEKDIVGALEANDDIAIDLLKSFASASPAMRLKIIRTMQTLKRTHDKAKTYPEDDIAEMKVQAAQSYMNALSTFSKQKNT